MRFKVRMMRYKVIVSMYVSMSLYLIIMTLKVNPLNLNFINMTLNLIMGQKMA